MGIDLPIRAALATLAALGASPAALAAVIEGQIVFPGQSVPAMTAYVCEVDTSRIRTLPIAPSQSRFSIEVPAGRYIVFLAPKEPGAPDIYGAHTRYSLCASHSPEDAGGGDEDCADHGLADVNLSGRASRAVVNIDDWYLSDGIAAQLDRIRGIEASNAAEPLAAPRFSEYKAAPVDALAAPRLDFGDSPIAAEERARLQQTLAGAPNFAGSYSVARTRCGAGCERLVLIDWRTGRILEPPAPGEIHGTLPCRAEDAVLFRRDSRLLSVTSTHGDGLLTQYFVFKPDGATLALTAEFQRSIQQYCAALPP